MLCPLARLLSGSTTVTNVLYYYRCTCICNNNRATSTSKMFLKLQIRAHWHSFNQRHVDTGEGRGGEGVTQQTSVSNRQLHLSWDSNPNQRGEEQVVPKRHALTTRPRRPQYSYTCINNHISHLHICTYVIVSNISWNVYVQLYCLIRDSVMNYSNWRTQLKFTYICMKT